MGFSSLNRNNGSLKETNSSVLFFFVACSTQRGTSFLPGTSSLLPRLPSKAFKAVLLFLVKQNARLWCCTMFYDLIHESWGLRGLHILSETLGVKAAVIVSDAIRTLLKCHKQVRFASPYREKFLKNDL